MLSLGSYLLGAVEVAVVALSLGFSAYRLRQRLLPAWDGAAARLVEGIVAVALLIWISELLGALWLLYAGTLVGACVLLAIATWLSPAGGGGAGVPRGAEAAPPPSTEGDAAPTGPAGLDSWRLLIMVGVVAVVFGHWALTTKHALDRGIFNFDSLWYHMPFAAEMVQSHSVTGMHHVDTVFTNWFYPQNSELLHADGMLLVGRDTLSLFLNYGWLVVAFLAAWCIGRPYGRGDLSVVGCGDPAGGARAGGARARGRQERPHGRGPDPGRDRDPRSRLGAGQGHQQPMLTGRKYAHIEGKRPINREACRSGGRWRRRGWRWGWRRGRR